MGEALSRDATPGREPLRRRSSVRPRVRPRARGAAPIGGRAGEAGRARAAAAIFPFRGLAAAAAASLPWAHRVRLLVPGPHGSLGGQGPGDRPQGLALSLPAEEVRLSEAAGAGPGRGKAVGADRNRRMGCSELKSAPSFAPGKRSLVYVWPLP